jgi:hypothetical protein
MVTASMVLATMIKEAAADQHGLRRPAMIHLPNAVSSDIWAMSRSSFVGAWMMQRSEMLMFISDER